MQTYGGVYFALALVFVFSGCGQEEPRCGLDPATPRVLSSWRTGVPGEAVTLTASLVQNGTSIVHIRIASTGPEGSGRTVHGFISDNRGRSWKESGIQVFNNVAVRHGRELQIGIMSSRNPNVLWRLNSPHELSLELSRDGGKSWEEIRPTLDAQRPLIRSFELLGAGAHREERLYARIRTAAGASDFVVCASDDYGRAFRTLSADVTYLVESRARESTLIGIGGARTGRVGIVLSEDGGRNWKKTEDEEVMRSLMIDSRSEEKTVFRTWSKKSSEHYVDAGDLYIDQIETVRSNEQEFYVVTWKGIYATRDRGNPFKLLDLATDVVDGIGALVVDSIDDNCLYAAVKESELYRSLNRGCSWEKLDLPAYRRGARQRGE